MCTTESTFAWVGTLVVNCAFIAFIAWGASKIWVAGFFISIVYTALLFVLARFIDRKSGWDATTHGDDESGSLHDEADVRMTHDVNADYSGQGDDPAVSGTEHRMPLLPNLLYGLFALALGVTGYFLPVNIFYCGSNRPFAPPGHWTTNITALPDDVQDWASSAEHRYSFSSFVYIPGEKVTLFQGSSVDGSNGATMGLWAAPASVYPFQTAEPHNFPDIENPTEFIVTGTGRACFRAYKNTPPPPPPNGTRPKPIPVPVPKLNSGNVIACCDGKTLQTTKDVSSNTTLLNPYGLYVENATKALWFKDDAAYSGPFMGTGTLIYSVDDYETMELTLHSTYHAPRGYKPPADGDDAEDCDKVERQRALMALFLSTLPVTITSVLLWVKRHASSMSITTYVGLSASAIFLFVLFSGKEYYSNWWYSISGLLFMLIMTDLSFCERSLAKDPFVWGINFGALAFFVGMIMLTGIFDQYHAWRWLVFNAFAIVPIGIVGLGTDQLFLLILCAIGWLMDSFRIAALLANDSPEAAAPIYFVVLGTSGLLIAGAGWLLSKHQDHVHNVIEYHMEQLSISRRLLPELGHVVLHTEDPLSEPISTSRHDGDNSVC